MGLKFEGKGKELFDDLFKNEQLQFPVEYHLKVILDATIPDEQNQAAIEKVLTNLKIRHDSWKDKLSREGRYISFTVNVEIPDKEILHALYKDLKEIPGIKFAI